MTIARTTPYRALWRSYLLPQRWRALLLLLFLLGGISIELASPLILRTFIDNAVAGAATATLVWSALLYLGLALLLQVIVVVENYLAEYIGLTATNQLRADVMLHCLQLDPSFHHAQTPGGLIERVDGDVATLSNFFGRFVIQLLGNALLLLGVIGLLWTINWRVGLAMTLWSVVAVTSIRRLSSVGVPHWAAARQSSADLFGFLEERLSGTEDIRANGAPGYVMSLMHGRSRSVLHKNRRAALMGMITGNTMVLLFGLATALSMSLGIYLFQREAITLGTVYVIFSYTQILNRPIEQLSRQFQDLQQATASITRIYDLFEQRSTIIDGDGPPLPPGPLAVSFEQVSFGYAEESPVLHEVNVHVPAGKVMGVLGRTGSGKSTLARLLTRLYDPSAGVVKLGDRDLRTLRLSDLRSNIGMVTQDIQLFHASLRNNLTLFDASIPDARLLTVLDQLGLRTWYAQLPDGLDTELAAEGSGLSAGEAQLLAFARVFLLNPGVVILDEASSRLDLATEELVEHAVSQLLAERTAIIIAHRLATVQRADLILVLDHGKIVEFGPRDELARDPDSHFYRLLQVGMEDAFA